MLLKKSHVSRPRCDFFLLEDSAPGVGEDIVASAQQSACLSSDFPDYFHRAPQNEIKINMSGMRPRFNPRHSSCSASHRPSPARRNALDTVGDFAPVNFTRFCL